MKKVKVVELFAGVGGFRCGLEKASKSFETIFANQWEPEKKTQHAFNCYVKNFGMSASYINEDIELVKNCIPEHDLLVAGFPCQDYSVANGKKANGIEGKKGVLWWSILDIIREKRPKMVLLENVDRLIKSPSSQRGRDFGIILRTLNDSEYNCEWRIINAADYGQAQKRRRIFIFATPRQITEKFFNISNDYFSNIKNGFFFKSFPFTSSRNVLTINLNEMKKMTLGKFSDTFNSTFFNSGCLYNGIITTFESTPQKNKSPTLNDIIEKNHVDNKYFISNLSKFKELKNYKTIRRMNKDGHLYQYSEGTMSFPDAMNKPARTLLTSESNVSRTTHVIEDKQTGKLRVLTPVECERLNGFPDNWTNTGMPEKFRYFCMGNALVVPLVERMGKRIIEILKVQNEK